MFLNYVRCVQSLVSMVILNPVKLTVKVNNCKRKETGVIHAKFKPNLIFVCIRIEADEKQKYRIKLCNKRKR